MLNELARVFGSRVAVPPRTGYVYAYQSASEEPQENPAESVCDHKTNCKCFGPKFDQASAKLELTRQGLAKSEAAGKPEEQLSEEQKKQVDELAKRDREVKAHESAHKAASGGHGGAATYEYQVGPDGKQYAVGGHVSIDASPVQGNPEATLAKSQAVRAAANAPADPSAQDRAVAAAAMQMAAEARKQIAAERSASAEAGRKPDETAEGEAGNGAHGTAAGGSNGGEATRTDPRIRDYGRAKAPTGSAFSAFG